MKGEWVTAYFIPKIWADEILADMENVPSCGDGMEVK